MKKQVGDNSGGSLVDKFKKLKPSEKNEYYAMLYSVITVGILWAMGFYEIAYFLFRIVIPSLPELTKFAIVFFTWVYGCGVVSDKLNKQDAMKKLADSD